MKGKTRVRLLGFFFAAILLALFFYGYGYTDTVKAEFNADNNNPSLPEQEPQPPSNTETQTNTPIENSNPLELNGYLAVRLYDTNGNTIHLSKQGFQWHSFSVLSGDRELGKIGFNVYATVLGGEPPYHYVLTIHLLKPSSGPSGRPMSIMNTGTGTTLTFEDDTDGTINVWKTISLPSWIQGLPDGKHTLVAYATISLTDKAGHKLTGVTRYIYIYLTVTDSPPQSSGSTSTTTYQGGLPPGHRYILPDSIVVVSNG